MNRFVFYFNYLINYPFLFVKSKRKEDKKWRKQCLIVYTKLIKGTAGSGKIKYFSKFHSTFSFFAQKALFENTFDSFNKHTKA